MMKYIKTKTLALFFLLAGLTGCDPDPLDIDLPVGKPMTVITPLINEDEVMGVLVTRSFSPLLSIDGDPEKLLNELKMDHLSVNISTGAYSEDMLDINPLFFSTTLPVKPFEEYRIRVTDSVTGKVTSARTIMLPKADTAACHLAIQRRPGDTLIRVKVDIKDDQSTAGYYLLTFFRAMVSEPKKQQGALLGKSLYQELEVFSNTGAVNGVLTFEKEYAQHLMHFGGSDTLMFSLSRISEDYYNFLKVYKKAGSLFNQLTGEPINFPRNVEGGTGYFFLTNPVRRAFILESL